LPKPVRCTTSRKPQHLAGRREDAQDLRGVYDRPDDVGLASGFDIALTSASARGTILCYAEHNTGSFKPALNHGCRRSRNTVKASLQRGLDVAHPPGLFHQTER